MYAFCLASSATALRMSAGVSGNDIEPTYLADLLKKHAEVIALGRLLIVDCRRFLDYNTSHIKNAVNVCCSKLIRKRLEENKISILDILKPSIVDSNGISGFPDDENETKPDHVQKSIATEMCCQPQLDVVLYADQCGVAAAALGMRSDRCGMRKCPDDVSFLAMLMGKLRASSQFNSVRMLKGGFVDFQARFPELCESASTANVMASPVGRNAAPNAPNTTVGSNSGAVSKLTLTSLSQPCLPASNQGPTKILPFLYLGSQQDAMDQDTMRKYGINYVLNMSVGCPKPEYVQDEHFLRIAVNDSYSEKLLPYFEKAFEFLDKVKEANSCALIHCLAGISRSPTLAIAYVMRHLHMSSEEAYRYVKEKRPSISPNFNFLGQLLEYEKQLKAVALRLHQNEDQQKQQHLQQQQQQQQVRPTPSPCGLSKTAASSPDCGMAKPMFLNLQKTNSPACASSHDVPAAMAQLSSASMKRSSSCPVKMQKSDGAFTGPLNLNFEFEFSPATRTNGNGKRRMITREEREHQQQQNQQQTFPKIEEKKQLTSSEKMEKLYANFAQQQPRRSFGTDAFPEHLTTFLKPFLEDLPSPSTELSKLTFEAAIAAESEDAQKAKNTVQIFKSCSSSLPHTPQQPLSSGGCGTGGFMTATPNTPQTCVNFTTAASSAAAIKYTNSATNPFFAGYDFAKRTYHPFGSKLRMYASEFDSGLTAPVAPQPMIVVDEMDEGDQKMDDAPAPDAQSLFEHCTSKKNGVRLFSYSPEDVVVTRSSNSTAENPLFPYVPPRVNTRKPRKTERKAQEPIAQAPIAQAPPPARLRNPARIRPTRSETQLAEKTPKLWSVDKFGSMMAQRVRHLLSKRASWPHALPFLTSSTSEAASLWALAPPEEAAETTQPSKSSSESTLFYALYNQQQPSETVLVAETAASALSPFDMDSPESGFVESPTLRDPTPPRSASPNMYRRHRDTERESLGSSSSLEIIVS